MVTRSGQHSENGVNACLNLVPCFTSRELTAGIEARSVDAMSSVMMRMMFGRGRLSPTLARPGVTTPALGPAPTLAPNAPNRTPTAAQSAARVGKCLLGMTHPTLRASWCSTARERANQDCRDLVPLVTVHARASGSLRLDVAGLHARSRFWCARPPR